MAVDASELLEREREVELLNELLASAGEGRGRLALVEGAPGIGKTSLLHSAVHEARASGMRVLSARGDELEDDVPLQVVRQLFEPAVRQASAAERSALLEGAAGFAAPLLGVPVEEPPGSQVGASSFPFVHGLYWLTVNLTSAAPILIAVDDAHWADAPSLRWLIYLARRVEELPVLLLVAARPAERNRERDLLQLLRTDPAAVWVRPAALSEPGVARVVRARLGADVDDELCAACHAATVGNPLLLSELLAALGADSEPVTAARVRALGPRSIARGVLWRVAALSPDAARVAAAVAVLGRDATLRRAAVLAEIDLSAAASVADALASVEVLRAGRRLEFVHAVVRTAIYDDMPSARRALLHRRAARILADDGVPAGEIAPHLMLSEPLAEEWTVDLLRAAAQRALERAAPEAAVTYLRRALDEPPPQDARIEVLLELGAAAALAADPAAVEHLAEGHRQLRDPRRRAATALDLGRAQMMSGRLDAALETFSSAIDELADADLDMALRLEAELIGAARLDITKRQDAASRLARVGRSMAGEGRAERLVLANLGFERVVRGEPAEETAKVATRALGEGRLLAEETSDSPVFYLAAWTLALSDRLEEADEALAAALVQARERGSALGFTIASCFRSNVSYRLGRIADAEADARAVLSVDPEHRWQLGMPLAVAFLIDALLERADVEDATAVLVASGLPDDLPNFTLFIPLLYSRGCLRVRRGDVDAGIADLLLCGERAKAWGSRNPTFIPWRSAAALAGEGRGRTAEARQLVAEELGLARRAHSRRAVGIALRTSGLLHAGDKGLALLRESVATLQESGSRLEHARSLAELGAMLRRANRRADARDPLRTALDVATRCGAVALADRARAELGATGARPRTAMLSGVESLTASERRVAGMAASGLSNREIAQALFVTIKTVEKHLGQAFAKLAVGSRAELVDALADAS